VMHVVATGDRRGAELFTFDLVNALAKLGIEQSIAVLRGPMAMDFGVPTDVLSRDGNGHRRMELSIVRKLVRTASRWVPDLVQAHGGEALKYAVISRQEAKRRLVYRRIGLFTPRTFLPGRRFGYSRLMRRAHRIVVVSEAGKSETVNRFGIPADRVLAIPNGVDPGRVESRATSAEIRREFGIRNDAVVLLSLGALTWEKDPIGQLEIGARVTQSVPGAVHLFVGDGPLRCELEAEVRRRNLFEKALVVGSRPRVGDVLAAADALLIASRTEGMPAVSIEAGLVGLPVVAYELAGIPEVVINGRTGMLAPQGRPDALARHAEALLRDEPLRRRLGIAAQAHCLERFHIGVIAPRYAQLFGDLVER
jgi:glycosyltransferase involved in cell wall biosynthesis